MLKIIEHSIDLGVPAAVAYERWVRFDEFPEFMLGVREVQLRDDAHMHWRAAVAGKEEEWDAEITERVPGQRVAWRATAGTPNSGVVTFYDMGEQRSRLMLRLRYEPHGITEVVGDSLGLVRWRVASDLKRFKDIIEDDLQPSLIPLSDALIGQ